MKNPLKLLLLIVTIFVCTISAFSQNAYLTYSANNGNRYKYSGLQGETMSKSDLLKIPELSVETGYVVKSFKVSAHIGSAEAERASTSSEFTDAQRSDIFKKASAGTKIYIEDIVVADKNGVRRKISPLIITVSASSQCEIIEGHSVAHLTYTDDAGAVQEYKIFSNDAVIPQSVLINALELYHNAEDIKSFSVSAKIGIYFLEYMSGSNKFTNGMRNEIFAKAPSGTKIYIENIKDGAGKSLPVILFMVK
ncbi:MAG: hypothetical protein FWC39_00495 [Bacteroidetes bacterium]|nr:hypothetical protein [Bacteroidota bacterium]